MSVSTIISLRFLCYRKALKQTHHYMPSAPHSMSMGELMNKMHDWKSWQQAEEDTRTYKEFGSKETEPKCPYFLARTKYYIFSMLSVSKSVNCLHFEDPYSNWYLCYSYLNLCMVRSQGTEIKSATVIFTELYYPKFNLTASRTRRTKFDTAIWKAPKHTNQIFVLGSPQINKDKTLTTSLFYLTARKT